MPNNKGKKFRTKNSTIHLKDSKSIKIKIKINKKIRRNLKWVKKQIKC
jgi:hypothetical protein